MRRKVLAYAEISTHTLTWSVTVKIGGLKNIRRISTHTLTWSVTGYEEENSVRLQFQLTRSRGA